MFSAVRRFEVRAYRVTNDTLVNKTVGELEGCPGTSGLHPAGPSTGRPPRARAEHGDPPGRRRGGGHTPRPLWRAGQRDRSEVQDRDLLDIPIEVLDVVVTNKALVGKSLAELAKARVRPRRLPAEARAGRRGDADSPPRRASTAAT